MVPTRLFLSNFLSYGDQVPPLDFTRFQVACLTGNNGHGKSALLDAMTYALWGEARKNTTERKPDEGLLRLGASEMRVEFCFELGENHFRIIRSFRKGRRTNSAQLELQILDEQADTFRPLSEGSSLTQTQRRINQLLSMDYDTFINSAFIVQGRADEFTQKGARQRKEVLAEVLGLRRFDQLQERARTHLQKKNQASADLQRRLQELNAELAHQDEYQSQLRELSIQLRELTAAVDASARALDELREQRLERNQLQSQLAATNQERTHLEERRRAIEQDREHLHAQRHRDSEILAASSTIQQNYATFQQLSARDGQLKQDMECLRELEAKGRILEARIIDERHEVERRCENWEASRQTLQNQLQHFHSLLERKETIETRYNLFAATRQQQQALEKQRLRHQILQRDQDQLQHDINLEKQRLSTREEALKTQVETWRGRLWEKKAIDQRILALEQEIKTLQLQTEDRDQVKEKGTTLRTQLAQQQQRLPELEEAIARAREKMLILQDSAQADCPLCGSKLDELHRLQLSEELTRQEQEQVNRLEQHRHNIRGIEKNLETMRHHFQHLEQQIQPLKDLRQELASQKAHQAQIHQAGLELQQMEDQLTTLNHAIKNGQYAAEQQQRLVQLKEELANLNYQEDQHTRVRETLEELGTAEVNRALLKDARAQEEKTLTELSEASEKLELARKYLEDKRYAQQERQELKKLQAEIQDLDYDPDEHRRIRTHMDELSDAVARRENLSLAQQRHTSNQEALKKNEKELDVLRKDLEKLAEEIANQEQRIRRLADVDQNFHETSASLDRMRTERDQLLQHQGFLQAQFDRCVEGAKERDQIQEQRRDVEKEVWVYQQLVEAFGKDGIQALIIENTIPEIEEEANSLLSRLTDNRIQISIESLRDLKKGGTRETLDIKIADEIGERSYHLYSGGEAFRTNFALRIALSKVLARRAGTRLRTLIIDEGFGTQDSQGLEHLVQAIQEISKDFDKLLVVTHLPELKNAFPVQVEVTKHPDIGSRFEIIENT